MGDNAQDDRPVTFSVLPACLQQVDTAPEQLYVRANSPDVFDALMQRPRIAIVGSRKVSAYGQATTYQLAHALASRGVVIVSGLAIGVDAIAHRAALDAGGLTLAVLPSPVQTVYPRRHASLAHDILRHHGALASEYPAGMPPLVHHFVARNRIVTALADALLITEATEQSGTLHTARFALEQGTDVLAVPGNITSPTSTGTNNLIKSGAIPITSVADVLHVLGLQDHASLHSFQQTATAIKGGNSDEQRLIDLIGQGIHDGNAILTASDMSVEQFNHHLTMLEITAKIRPLGNNQWALR